MSVESVLRGEKMHHVEQTDCLAGLRRMPSCSVPGARTSPPFWALRAYRGVEPSLWRAVEYAPMPGLPLLAIEAMECCLGLEPTPEAFVAHLVMIFRELWRVLRSDGTLWVNLGDSFGSKGGTTNRVNSGKQLTNSASKEVRRPYVGMAKNLVLIP